jgi:carbamoyltransferase
MILGLTFSHDASAAILHEDGRVFSAVGEERLSRKKNHIGIPRLAIPYLLSGLPSELKLSKIIIGSHANMDRELAIRLSVSIKGNPSNPASTALQTYPGFHSKNLQGSGRSIIEESILELIPQSSREESIKFDWVNHHDSHLGCALGLDQTGESLLFSFDGSGDGESAAIAVKRRENSDYHVLARVPAADSLGGLYSAITRRYNFKASQHEGKITGLAAYGQSSAAFDFLRGHVSVVNGVPEIEYVKDFKKKLAVRALRHFGIGRKALISLGEIADLASSRTSSYADLAWAVQKTLEESILEIITYWSDQQNISAANLAGGVFANVKLNQRISELPSISEVKVFPNMGDGGISVGGVWSYLSKKSELSKEALYKNMFLAPNEGLDQITDRRGLVIQENHNYESHVIEISKEISEGKLVAIHQGDMEFGPRALGNRSLILDARNEEIIGRVNKRLNRTEFMPFAPVVLEQDFSQYFRTSNQSLQPFWYMTMTCDVLESRRSQIPAVTHIDGTARPQLVSENSNPFLYRVMLAYKDLTGCGVLVNTSLNMHEEPINASINDSIKALRLGGIDVLYTRSLRIELG